MDYNTYTDEQLIAGYEQIDSNYLQNEMRDSGWDEGVHRHLGAQRQEVEQELRNRGYALFRDELARPHFSKAGKGEDMVNRTMQQINNHFGGSNA